MGVFMTVKAYLTKCVVAYKATICGSDYEPVHNILP